ncbi:glycosyltransferase family 4 protein [Novosphingobium profundi]|uniref:glycosyltransferase family 4 protein n=1 Tax=Novosphingobium profundi TaxID=1774954 RepID=UPI001CFF2A2B|nr:glycosyltransferase family 4 protein [Novosphingobium profundi]
MPSSQTPPQHILIVTSGLGAGGAEQVIAQLAHHLVEAGHEVDVAAFDTDEARIYHELPLVSRVFRLGGRSGFSGVAGRVMALRGLVARRRPDVVLSFLTKINLVAALAVQGHPARLICAERNNPEQQQLHPLWNLALRWFYRRADTIICQTEGVRRCFAHDLQGRLVTIPNPVPEPDVLRGEGPSYTVCAVGRLTYQKGFDRLIEAFADIAADYPEWRVAIWGEGPDREALEARIRERGMEGRIVLRGLGERPRSWIREADLFVLSSRYEGFPNALAEAMAAGLPVLATRCDFGPEDMISDGENGLLVEDEGTSPALGTALARLLDDAPLRERLGKAAACSMLRFRPAYVLRRWDEVLRHSPGHGLSTGGSRRGPRRASQAKAHALARSE